MTSKTIAGAATVGAGAISLRRPDGRFLLVHANNTNATSIFDPYDVAAAVTGPTVCTTSTSNYANAFQRPDGRYVIMCGGGTTWGTYDPSSATTTGIYTAGVPTAAPGTFGNGAHALQRDDGTFLVLFGGAASTNAVFNANMTMSGQTSPWSNPNVVLPHTASGAGTAPVVSTGAVSVRRQDGKYLIIPGPAGASFIYDPTPNMTGTTSPYGTFTSAPAGPTSALGDGAQLMWRPDGKYILAARGRQY